MSRMPNLLCHWDKSRLAGFRSKDPAEQDAAIHYFASLDHDAAGEVLVEHERLMRRRFGLKVLTLAIATIVVLFGLLYFTGLYVVHFGFPGMLLCLCLTNLSMSSTKTAPIDFAAVYVNHEESANRILTWLRVYSDLSSTQVTNSPI